MLVFLFLFFSTGLLARSFPENFTWQTGQILAVSQREAEPSTVLFEFMTGSRYGHVGVVVVEEGAPWVYEATHPFVRRVSVYDFLSTVSENELGQKELTVLAPEMELSMEEQEKLVKYVREQSDNKTPYNYSGTRNPGKLNCAEFVHEAFKKADLPAIGTYQNASELNFSSLNGKLLALWGKKKVTGDMKILSPLSIVSSPWLKVKHTTLPHDKILSDKELFHEWIKTASFKRFVDRFSVSEDDVNLMRENLSNVPKAKYPVQCNSMF